MINASSSPFFLASARPSSMECTVIQPDEIKKGLRVITTLVLFRQGAPDRLIVFSAHQDMMTCCRFFKKFEVSGQIPRNLVVLADDAIARHGDDCRN